jgi:crotonobetainyl-CoA:carnitine CoA-transferase CaiB-like acyl-CoA transferase
MGLTYATLGKINPAIVCASLTAYGRHGERASQPGYDPLVQAEAGWASLTGDPDGPPVKSGLSLADYAAGLGAALALMIALFDVGRTGRGRDVDTSLYDMALGLLTYPAAWYLSAGIQARRYPMSAHPSLIPFQFMQTADGYLAVACAKEKFFQDLIAAMELPEVAADPRFASFATRREHREELSAILGASFREKTTAEWLERLRGRVPCAPVRSLAEALDLEELEEREMLASYEHPIFGKVSMTGTPFTLSGFRPTYSRAPAYNADQQEILDELGYSEAERAELAASGAFGSH